MQDAGRSGARNAFDQRRPRLSRCRARAQRASRQRSRRVPRRDRLPRRWPHSTSSACSRASSPRSSRRTPSTSPPRSRATMPADDVVLVCLSGRGDKDIDTVREFDARVSEHRHRSRGSTRHSPRRHRRALPGLIPYFTAGYPTLDSLRELLLLRAASRVHRRRGRHSIQRSARRRTHHPAHRTGGARQRDDPRNRAATRCATRAQRGVTHPARGDDICQSSAQFRRSRRSPVPRRRRASTAPSFRTFRSTRQQTSARRCTPRASRSSRSSRRRPRRTASQRICSTAAGFVYCVGVTGVTGARSDHLPTMRSHCSTRSAT